MEGVDYFPEGEIHTVPESNINVKSKGATFKKVIDAEDISKGKIGESNDEVYGPRMINDKKLFSKYFQKKYQEYRDNDGFKNELDKNDPENINKNNSNGIIYLFVILPVSSKQHQHLTLV